MCAEPRLNQQEKNHERGPRRKSRRVKLNYE